MFHIPNVEDFKRQSESNVQKSIEIPQEPLEFMKDLLFDLNLKWNRIDDTSLSSLNFNTNEKVDEPHFVNKESHWDMFLNEIQQRSSLLLHNEHEESEKNNIDDLNGKCPDCKTQELNDLEKKRLMNEEYELLDEEAWGEEFLPNDETYHYNDEDEYDYEEEEKDKYVNSSDFSEKDQVSNWMNSSTHQYQNLNENEEPLLRKRPINPNLEQEITPGIKQSKRKKRKRNKKKQNANYNQSSALDYENYLDLDNQNCSFDPDDTYEDILKQALSEQNSQVGKDKEKNKPYSNQQQSSNLSHTKVTVLTADMYA